MFQISLGLRTEKSPKMNVSKQPNRQWPPEPVVQSTNSLIQLLFFRSRAWICVSVFCGFYQNTLRQTFPPAAFCQAAKMQYLVDRSGCCFFNHQTQYPHLLSKGSYIQPLPQMNSRTNFSIYLHRSHWQRNNRGIPTATSKVHPPLQSLVHPLLQLEHHVLQLLHLRLNRVLSPLGVD